MAEFAPHVWHRLLEILSVPRTMVDVLEAANYPHALERRLLLEPLAELDQDGHLPVGPVDSFLPLVGPTYVGAASDFFHTSHAGHSLQIAFYTLVPFYILAIVLFLWLARMLGREDARTGGRVR